MKILLIFLTCILLACFISAEVRINEVMPHTNNSLGNEWVELYNDGGSKVELLNWTIGDHVSNDSFSINISAQGFALIVDAAINCSSLSVPLESCVNLTNIGNGLSDSSDSIYLYNFSNIISSFSWTSSITSFGKSFGYNGTSWQNCTPTPGSINNCTIITQAQTCTPSSTCGSWGSCSDSQQTRTCINTSGTCQNTSYTLTQSCDSSSSITLTLDWNEEDIVNGQEFPVTLTAEDLENDKYAVRIWIEDDDKNIISERYGNYSDNGDSWVSGSYYIYNFFKGPGKESDEVKLRIKEEYSNFSGDATIFFRIKDGDEEEINKDIEILKENNTEEISNQDTEESLLPTASNENTQTNAVITLGSKIDSSSSTEDSIIYKSKTEYIREYAPYAFSVVCIIIMIFMLIDKKNGRK